MGERESGKDSKGIRGIKDSIAGTIAGAACLFTGHPFDTIKVRLQTGTGTQGALSTLQKTVTDEGFFALYKGVTSPLVGMMMETAVLFLVYGQLKLLMQKDPSTPLTLPQFSIAGGCSGAACSFVLTPVELIKCRLQVQKGRITDKNMKYKGPLDCMLSVLRTEGAPGLYRGLGATLAREIPGNMAFFGVYEGIRRALTPKGKTVDDLGLGALIFSGGIGGIAYWSIFYPSDVAKSQIQTMDKPISLLSCLKHIYATNGFRGLYRGYHTFAYFAF